MAVMTSGTYRHYFDDHGQRYSHILDARNGRPITHNLVSVTVLISDPTVADAWSTALLCLGPQRRHGGSEYGKNTRSFYRAARQRTYRIPK